MIDAMTVVDNYKVVCHRVSEATQGTNCAKQSNVQLICVSKRKPVSLMQALIDAETVPIVFGENYVQEWAEKKPLLRGAFESHLIGSLQSNKVKRAVQLFDVIQTVDSVKLAERISREAIKTDKTMHCFLQVNISEDPSKNGFLPTEINADLIRRIQCLSHVVVRGLMTITRYYEEAENARAEFARLRVLRDALLAEDTSLGTMELSMGMSADYEVAIEEGASMVRVGSAIFGDR